MPRSALSCTRFFHQQVVVINVRSLALHQLCGDTGQRGMLEYVFVFRNTLPISKILKETARIAGATCHTRERAGLGKIGFDAARQRFKLARIQCATNDDGTVTNEIIDRGCGEDGAIWSGSIGHA